MAGLLPLRRRLMLSVVGAVAVALVLLIGAFNLVLRARLSHEADNALAARTSAVLASLHVAGGRLVAPEAPDAGAPDAQAWVFSGRQALELPRASRTLTEAALRLSHGGRRTYDPAGTATRLYTVPVIADGRRYGSVVAQVSLAPYRSSAQTALVASVILGVLLLGLVAIAAGILIRGALRPVSEMTAQAAAWSRVDAGQRFALGPPRDELTQLAATLDGLLDRVASSLRHEQQFSAELSHELRSPLASVIAEAQLALRHGKLGDESRGGYERILTAAQQMRRTLDTLLAAARIEHQSSFATGDPAQAAQAAAHGCAAVAAARGVRVEIEEPKSSTRVGVETDVAERILAPVLENACRYGAASVRVAIGRQGNSVLITVVDDGPGVPVADLERVFEPGWRNGSEAAEHPGAGLGLPLARRLARAAGGDVVAAPNPGGRFEIRLPRG